MISCYDKFKGTKLLIQLSIIAAEKIKFAPSFSHTKLKLSTLTRVKKLSLLIKLEIFNYIVDSVLKGKNGCQLVCTSSVWWRIGFLCTFTVAFDKLL